MNLADFLRRGLSPLNQQAMADNQQMSLAGELSRHGSLSPTMEALRPGLAGSVMEAPERQGQREQVMGEIAMSMMPGAGITAFHGSPHNFSKFDMSKIGTGEGAQAYGHGLYFAENPGVAKDYQKKLASRDFENPDGSVFDPFEHLVNPNVRATLQKTDGDVKATIDRANELIKSIPGTQGAEYAQKDIDVLSKLQGLKRSEGNLYKVDIPDDQIAKMLDWDKPFGQQTPKIQKSLRKLFPESYLDDLSDQWNMNIELEGMTGDELHQMVKRAGAEDRMPPLDEEYLRALRDDERAALFLKKQGIPGIKYLDGGSRTGGKGTSNFVLFSDEIAKILERNGQPIGDLAGTLRK